MSLSDRLKQAGIDPGDLDVNVDMSPDAVEEEPAPPPQRRLLGEVQDKKETNPLVELKVRAQQALFSRLGSRLYDSSMARGPDPSIRHRRARRHRRVREHPAHLRAAGEARRRDRRQCPRPRTHRGLPRRRHRHRGHGRRRQRDLRRARRPARGDRHLVRLRGAPPPGDRAHRLAGRPSHRRSVADGRCPASRWFSCERHHPAAGRRRLLPDDPEVLQDAVHGRGPDRVQDV